MSQSVKVTLNVWRDTADSLNVSGPGNFVTTITNNPDKVKKASKQAYCPELYDYLVKQIPEIQGS